jgi:hypothetical protein
MLIPSHFMAVSYQIVTGSETFLNEFFWVGPVTRGAWHCITKLTANLAN